MLVGQENCVDVLHPRARVAQQFSQAPTRKTRVDKHARPLRLEQGAVARATAAKDLKTHRHGCAWPSPRPPGRQLKNVPPVDRATLCCSIVVLP